MKKRNNRRVGKMWIAIVIAVCLIGIVIFLMNRHRRIVIPVVEVYSQEILISVEEFPFARRENINIIINELVRWEEAVSAFDLGFDIQTVDFSKESIVLITNHEAKTFSYNVYNRKYSGLSLDRLDIVLYPEVTNKVHLYTIPSGIIMWCPEKHAHRAPTFAE